MKTFNFTQVKRALENKGFSATKSFSSDTEYTTTSQVVYNTALRLPTWRSG